MNFTKLKEKNKGVTTALVQMAVMATSFSASAATAAYYVSRRGNYVANGSKNYLVDPAMPRISNDLFKYRKISTKVEVKKNTVKDLTIRANVVSELLIVDQNIKNYQQFSALIKPGVALLEIPKGINGFSFMLEQLARYKGLKAVHLFSHSNAGELLLGNTLVNSDTLSNHPLFANVVNGAIEANGDFLLYGCELGKDQKGDEFLKIIKAKTHVDVAASSNLTGNVAFNADWELEIKKGDIAAKPLANSVAMKDFTGVLQNVVFQKSTWTVVNAGAFDQWGGTAGTKNAQVRQNVNGVPKTLFIDGEYSSTGMTPQGELYFGRSEKSITISFTDGSTFKPVAIEIYAYQGDPATITTNNGGSINVTVLGPPNNGYTSQVIDLSTLPAGATSLKITNNAWTPFLVNANNGFMGQIRKVTFANITTSVLPVQLADFSVKSNLNDVVLQWQTLAETDNKKFVIYRSDNEKVFKELASIPSAASSSALKNYTWTDKKPLQGNNYYKLVQVDADGKETELGIRNVMFTLKSQATIYPNPTSDKATIIVEAGKYQRLSLQTLDGKELTAQKISASQTDATLDLSGYAKGAYLIKLMGNGVIDVHKVVKK